MSTVLQAPLGVVLRDTWVAERAADASADAVLQELLVADIGGQGGVVERSGLPGDVVNAAQPVRCAGPLLVQVDEAVDVSLPAREAAKNVAAGGRGWNNNPNRRVLRLCLTDGLTQFEGLEVQRCGVLDNTLLPGCKLLLKNVEFRHGVALLTRDCLTPLGGYVHALCQMDAAHWRQALLEVVGKPYLSVAQAQAQAQAHVQQAPGAADDGDGHSGGGGSPAPPRSATVATPAPGPRQTTLDRFMTPQRQQQQQQGRAEEDQRVRQPQQQTPSPPSPAPPPPQQQQPQQPSPLSYLFDVGRPGGGSGSGTATVRGYMVELAGMLQYLQGSYELAVVIDDGSARVVCQMHDRVVTLLVGVPAPELARCQHADPARFEQLSGALAAALEHGAAYVLTLTLGTGPPVIEALAPMTETLAAPLAGRAQSVLATLQHSKDAGAQRLLELAVMRTAR